MSTSTSMFTQLQEEYSQELVSYAEGILNDANIQFADETERYQGLADLLKDIKTKVDEALVYATPEEKLEELNDLLDAGDDEKLQAFFAANIENLDDYLTNVLLEYREMLFEKLLNTSENK